MKLDGYKIVSESIENDDLTIGTNKGAEKIRVTKRPISTMGPETVDGAVKTAEEYHAKVKEDPKPSSLGDDTIKKGTPSGDIAGKSLKEKPSIMK